MQASDVDMIHCRDHHSATVSNHSPDSSPPVVPHCLATQPVSSLSCADTPSPAPHPPTSTLQITVQLIPYPPNLLLVDPPVDLT